MPHAFNLLRPDINVQWRIGTPRIGNEFAARMRFFANRIIRCDALIQTAFCIRSHCSRGQSQNAALQRDRQTLESQPIE